MLTRWSAKWSASWRSTSKCRRGATWSAALHHKRQNARRSFSRRELLVERLLVRIRTLPGVERAAVAPNLPLDAE